MTLARIHLVARLVAASHAVTAQEVERRQAFPNEEVAMDPPEMVERRREFPLARLHTVRLATATASAGLSGWIGRAAATCYFAVGFGWVPVARLGVRGAGERP